MTKTIIILLNFAFNCMLVNETCTVVLMQAGTQANQLASVIGLAGNITNFTKNCTSKSFFSSQNSKETCSLISVSVIKKVYQEDIPFVKTIHMYVFIKGTIGKMNCYWHVHFSSICMKLANIKSRTILHTLYPLLIKTKEKKLFKNMDSSKNTTVKLPRKID